MTKINESFAWKCEAEAEAEVLNILQECAEKNPFISDLEIEFHKATSTRLFDWLDHVVVGYSVEREKKLEKAGFIAELATPSYRVLFHPGAQLPRIMVRDDGQSVGGVAIKVDSIADFLMVHRLTGWIEGTPFTKYRRCVVSTENGISLWVVERRVRPFMEPTFSDSQEVEKYHKATEKWQSRPRDLEDEGEAISLTLSLAEEIVSMLGSDLASWVVLECERKYWQSRNLAAQMQKNRQDSLGLGWANHDHHTFRSSRKHFPKLVRLFEILGFHCRERFYAGKEAGWGAQVMENSHSGLILFLDLDLAPEELEIDFAHQPLLELDHLGTVGLWCALHGDSILKAGMHHLEAQFLFEDLREDLHHHGIAMMEPFSNFSYLKQAFTHGEVWNVEPSRVEKLLTAGKIKPEEAEKFLKYGAVGSHLENLQRREGYKGFNQKNVSLIIEKTDPRNF